MLELEIAMHYHFRVSTKNGALYISGKLPTYSSPKPTSTLISRLGQNVGYRGGVGGQFPRNK